MGVVNIMTDDLPLCEKACTIIHWSNVLATCNQFAGFEVLVALLLRTRAFRSVMLFHWVSAFQLLEDCNVFIFQGQAVQEDFGGGGGLNLEDEGTAME